MPPTRKSCTRSSPRTSRKGTSCRGRSASSRSAPGRFVVATRGRKVIGCAELAPLSAASGRGAVARGRQGRTRRPRRGDDRRRAAAARAARRLREAVCLHARAELFHPHGLLDRAAPVAHREDLHRLREVPALPAVRPVRDGRAARFRVRRGARLRAAGGHRGAARLHVRFGRSGGITSPRGFRAAGVSAASRQTRDSISR